MFAVASLNIDAQPLQGNVDQRVILGASTRAEFGSSQTSGQSYSSLRSNTNNARHHFGGSNNSSNEPRYLDLTDVLLCLSLALTWTVWMLTGFVRTDLWKFHDQSVVVAGNVRQVQIAADSLGTGIPCYSAIIDYMIHLERRAETDDMVARWTHTRRNCGADDSVLEYNHSPASPGNANGNHAKGTVTRFQIRKQFQTTVPLEEGFANVELLVLPHEPTVSMLKEDWKRELLEQQQDVNDGAVCCRPVLCRRLSMIFAGVLVLVSIGGAVLVVDHMDPVDKGLGWGVFCIGTALLLPSALGLHRLGTAVSQMLSDPSKTGRVLQGAEELSATTAAQWDCQEFDVLDARACDDEGEILSAIQHQQQEGFGGSQLPLPHGRRRPLYAHHGGAGVPDTAGCYFIRFPLHRHQNRTRSHDVSISDGLRGV
ncbi:predicted protein [Phaeodactylum tricornutum CCAP 1055/1]|uniref:Transmembrane protein n=2 Tax=Phaeodactylum tricornutum TaxID=2850 RepID=B7FWC3_PHATC|nr:predicted protein [Phaeodactylum tricornutum CCAP 1055/1]EEC49179.1 predicted protein [Phaeodactylum tricornutum CCAP 1055/1]|eukprot:XP_002179356.1 predicted protein [Phaeodactylum tricornutum CCAP 1055/1]